MEEAVLEDEYGARRREVQARINLWFAFLGQARPVVSIDANDMHRFVRERRAGRIKVEGRVLKVGVSFSTKRSIPQIEPGTAAYETRVQNLQGLRSAGLHCAAVLKPILADVPVDEYLEIVDDTSAFTDLYLLGDRYLESEICDRTSPEGAQRTTRAVKWAVNQPIWPVEVAAAHVAAIQSAISGKGCRYFDSDDQLMNVLSVSLSAPRYELVDAGITAD